MYIHLLMKNIMIETNIYNIPLFIVLSIIISVLLLKLLEKNKVTSLLFLGDIRSIKFNKNEV